MSPTYLSSRPILDTPRAPLALYFASQLGRITVRLPIEVQIKKALPPWPGSFLCANHKSYSRGSLLSFSERTLTIFLPGLVGMLAGDSQRFLGYQLPLLCYGPLVCLAAGLGAGNSSTCYFFPLTSQACVDEAMKHAPPEYPKVRSAGVPEASVFLECSPLFFFPLGARSVSSFLTSCRMHPFRATWDVLVQ